MELISIVIVAVVAVLLWWLSQCRVNRIRRFTDQYAIAFCEAADHLLGPGPITTGLCYDKLDGGSICVRPLSEQPQVIQDIVNRGVDDYAVAHIHTMFQMRENAQELLTSFNLIGNRYNMVLNHTYSMTNLFFTVLDDITMIESPKDLEGVNAYITKQSFIRTVTLGSIISEECKKKITLS